MKKLIIILLMAMAINAYSQGSMKVDFREFKDYTTFTATKDTTWDETLSGAYLYEYSIKWKTLNATDSYLSVYLGCDPDGDGTLDWVLDTTLTIDSLQLTPASGVAKIQNLSGGIISDGIRLNYYHGTVSSGTVDLELNLITKETGR